MKAYKVSVTGAEAYIAAFSHGLARAKGLKSLKDLGVDCKFTEIKVVRAYEYDKIADKLTEPKNKLFCEEMLKVGIV